MMQGGFDRDDAKGQGSEAGERYYLHTCNVCPDGSTDCHITNGFDHVGHCAESAADLILREAQELGDLREVAWSARRSIGDAFDLALSIDAGEWGDGMSAVDVLAAALEKACVSLGVASVRIGNLKIRMERAR